MKIRYELTVDDLVVFNRYHCANSPSIQRNKWKYNIIRVVFIFLLAFLTTTLIPTSLSWPMHLLFAVIFSILYVLLINRFYSKRVDKQARLLVEEGSANGVLGEQELEISPEFLVAKAEHNTSSHAWKGIDRIIETDDYVFIYVTALSGHAIAKSRILEGDVAAFTKQAKEYLAAHHSEVDRD